MDNVVECDALGGVRIDPKEQGLSSEGDGEYGKGVM